MTVWDDICDNAAEAEDLAARSRIMLYIKERLDGLGARAFADEPWLTDLLDGKLSKFSLDDLIDISSAVGL